MGTTGSGKSTVLKDLLRQARARGDRAVIFDLTGSFVETFYESGRDILLNPLDVRCPRWSIFQECADRVELHSAARALIPSDGGRSDPFWIDAARLLLVEACLKLIDEKKTTNADLYHEIMTSVIRDLHEKLAGTVAGPLTEPEAKRMAESIRAVLNANAQAIRLLPRKGEAFSIRKWVQEDDGSGGFLFIGCKITNLDTLRSLMTLWYDTAIHALMDKPPAADRLQMWFVFDELGALHRLPSLEDGMRTSRNFGGAFALGLHTIQQLWSVYGQHEGDTIASLGRTQLYLAQPDYRSAEWCSQMIGKTEFRESERSTTVGVERIRDGIGWTQRTEYRAITLPEQIMNLPSLRGFLKFPEGYPAALIELPHIAYPQRAAGFIKRRDLEEEPARPRRRIIPHAPPPEASDHEQGVRETPAPASASPAGPGAGASPAYVRAAPKRRGRVAAQQASSKVQPAARQTPGKDRSTSQQRKGEGQQEKGTRRADKPAKDAKATTSKPAKPGREPPQTSEGPALERRHGLEVALDRGDRGIGDD
jgi:type IV conjugative transfer system coupling protein TraD